MLIAQLVILSSVFKILYNSIKTTLRRIKFEIHLEWYNSSEG
jgi:hypothetical protein